MTWNEESIKAKNKRRAQPSGRIRQYRAKKKKTISIDCRYVGDWEGPECLFGSDFFNKEWHKYWGRYNRLTDAIQAVKALNHKDDNFKYRLHKPKKIK